MDNETAQTIIKLLDLLLAKPDALIKAAYVTVGGMLGVAFLTAMTQWIVTKNIIRSEHQRINNQLNSEFRLRQFESWQKDFKETIANLLQETDPQLNPSLNNDSAIPHILRAQLMLNLDIPSHKKVNGIINNLGLAVTGWQSDNDAATLLNIHASLLDAAKDIMYLPGKK